MKEVNAAKARLARRVVAELVRRRAVGVAPRYMFWAMVLASRIIEDIPRVRGEGFCAWVSRASSELMLRDLNAAAAEIPARKKQHRTSGVQK